MVSRDVVLLYGIVIGHTSSVTGYYAQFAQILLKLDMLS